MRALRGGGGPGYTSLTNRMVAALWIIVVLSNVTAIQRVVFTYLELKRGGIARPHGEGS